MASGSGPFAKTFIFLVCLALFNDAWSAAIGTKHQRPQGWYHLIRVLVCNERDICLSFCGTKYLPRRTSSS